MNKILNPKVLVVATSNETRGGITSVVKAHRGGIQWRKYQCKWIETHIDRGLTSKLFYFLRGFLEFIIYVPYVDLVHVHTSEPPSAIRKLPFIFLTKLFRKKLIVHFHSFSTGTTINSKFRWVYKYLFDKADCVLVLSKFWKNEIDKSFPLGDRVSVLYNPSSKADYTIEYVRKNHILYAGTINARKGYADLLHAFSKVNEKYKDWKLVFAGNGQIEDGLSLAKSLDIENQIVFLGWVGGGDKSKAFQEASIFCLPSYAEGFPMAVLDAWAYRLPVITTPVGGLPDVLVPNENALVFNPGDIDELSLSLTRLIENDKLRNKIAAGSEKLSQELFSEEVLCAQLDRIYQKVLGIN